MTQPPPSPVAHWSKCLLRNASLMPCRPYQERLNKAMEAPGRDDWPLHVGLFGSDHAHHQRQGREGGNQAMPSVCFSADAGFGRRAGETASASGGFPWRRTKSHFVVAGPP